MATVKVRMYATVREYAGSAEAEVVAEDMQTLFRLLGKMFGERLSKLLRSLDGESVVILLNGKNVRPGSWVNVRLHEGDEVSIFPPVSGG